MRILNVKRDGVTRGVLDKNVEALAHLIEVTFVDDFGTARTVYAHKDGPFKDAEEIARAAIDGTLHDKAEEQPEPEQPPPPQGNAFAGNHPIGG
jgi:hypothetical protein